MSHPMGRVFVHCFELQLRDCGGAREKPENLEKNLRIKATNQQQSAQLQHQQQHCRRQHG